MKIDKSILKFLTDLSKNNNKPWFDTNKEVYTDALEKYNLFLKEVHSDLSKFDMIDELKRFRIYRDIRFSKDKTPYKNNFGTGFVRSTTKLRGGYYLHIEPGNHFVGGGFWAPEPNDIKRIRDEFSYDTETISKIQNNKDFKKYFGQIQGDALKNPPRGYNAELANIDLIKKKQWIVMRSFTDKEIMDESFSKEVVKTFKTMKPFFDYMSEVLTTDINGEPLN